MILPHTEISDSSCPKKRLNKKYGILVAYDDVMVWLPTKDGAFFVKSSFLADRRVEPFPHGIVWNSWVPLRISFFAWEAPWAKILTLDQLKKGGWRIPNRCYLCKEEEETSDHILIHRSKAHLLWQLIFALFGIQWVLSCSVREVLLSWHRSFVGKKRKKAWKASPLCMFWALWRERNRRAFDNFESTNQTIKNSFLYLFWDWVRLYIEGGSLSLLDFVDWVGSR